MTKVIHHFFILLFLTFFPYGLSCAVIGEKDFHFHQLSVNQGLSQYDVTSIVQDTVGYIWIGTYDGLNRYNGYENIVYRHKNTSENVPPGNRVLCLSQGPDKNIWIGTEDGGLGVYNIFRDRFMFIKNEGSSIPFSISALYFYEEKIIAGTTAGSIYISDINTKEDTVYVGFEEIKISEEELSWNLIYVSSIDRIENTLLIGYSDGGLIQLKEDGDSFEFKQVITRLSTWNIYVENQKHIWASTYSGLKCYEYLNEYETIVDITPDVLKKREDLHVTSVCKDFNGNIWFTTYLYGLFQLQKTENDQLLINQYSTQNSGISTDKLSVAFIDKSNTMWIGSHNDGVRMIDLYQKEFYRVSFYYEKLNISKDQNIISESCYVDKYGKVWVALSDRALFLYNKDKEIRKFSTSETGHQLHSNTITNIIEDKTGNLWFTSYEGIYKISAINNKSGNYIFEQINTGIDNADRVNQGAFYSICEDNNGNIWIGGRSGLLKCKITESGRVTEIIDYTNLIDKVAGSFFWPMTILPGPELNLIFVGTKGGGLYQIAYTDDSDEVELVKLTQSSGSDFSFNKNIWALHHYNKELWVGSDEGVYIFLRNKDHYEFSRHLSSDNGLSSNKVVSFENDLSGNIWMGTGFGLSKFEAKDSSIINYFYEDGILNNAFNTASASDSQGRLYFGGISGIILFNPDDIKENKRISDVQITNLFINYQKLEPGSVTNRKDVVDKSIPFISNIELDYFENNFFIEFLSFDFFKSNHISFEYKLGGFDKEWIRSYKNSRVAYYSGIPPGDYNFQVRLVNNNDKDTVLSDKSFLISISPPPWFTWWAFVIYLVVIFGVFYSILYHFREKHKYKNEILIEQHKREQEHELNEMKMRFFSDVSHDLRTPLILIMEPLRILISSLKDNPKLSEYLHVANVNAQKLYHFITQLLDFRLAETGNVNYNPEKNDIVSFTKVLYDSFKAVTDKNSIWFHFQCEVDFTDVYFDKDIIDKILSNLLTNAVKFTNSGGSIILRLSIHEKNGESKVAFEVIDNGIGIPYEDQDKIFQRFKHSKERPGFGIGLSLSQNLANLHGGSLSFTSEPGKGSNFCLKIPLVKDVENEIQNKNSPVHYKAEHHRDWIVNGDLSASHFSTREVVPEQKHTILFAEDNTELREFLVSFLKENFTVIPAVNGQEAYDLAIKEIPDIIVTDIMMPVLDGLSLAKKLAANTQTSHIPIIFLTARDMDIDQNDGMGTGAVDYIIKPFNVSFLQAKIENLLHILKLQQDKNWRNVLNETYQPEGNSNIDQFIVDACEIVNRNIANSDFSINEFCQELGVSRMKLHRKLKGAVGQSTSEFIRNLKMKHAADLLTTGKYNISEVMYEVGFDNPSYFTKSFKNVYGLSPSEYLLTKAEVFRTKT